MCESTIQQRFEVVGLGLQASLLEGTVNGAQAGDTLVLRCLALERFNDGWRAVLRRGAPAFKGTRTEEDR